jgi:hypothetical protein
MANPLVKAFLASRSAPKVVMPITLLYLFIGWLRGVDEHVTAAHGHALAAMAPREDGSPLALHTLRMVAMERMMTWTVVVLAAQIGAVAAFMETKR